MKDRSDRKSMVEESQVCDGVHSIGMDGGTESMRAVFLMLSIM